MFEELKGTQFEKPGLYDPKEEGQGMIEYALLLVLMAIVVIVLAGSLGQDLKEVYSQIVSSMP
jgi:pilus assembly protein Flp/PilA